MEQTEHNILSMALRSVGVRVDKNELDIILALYELTKERGEDVSMKDISKVIADLNK